MTALSSYPLAPLDLLQRFLYRLLLREDFVARAVSLICSCECCVRKCIRNLRLRREALLSLALRWVHGFGFQWARYERWDDEARLQAGHQPLVISKNSPHDRFVQKLNLGNLGKRTNSRCFSMKPHILSCADDKRATDSTTPETARPRCTKSHAFDQLRHRI